MKAVVVGWAEGHQGHKAVLPGLQDPPMGEGRSERAAGDSQVCGPRGGGRGSPWLVELFTKMRDRSEMMSSEQDVLVRVPREATRQMLSGKRLEIQIC